MSDEQSIESLYPLLHKELQNLKIKLNFKVAPLNQLLKHHGLPEIIEEYDSSDVRRYRMNGLENHLKRQEVEWWLFGQMVME